MSTSEVKKAAHPGGMNGLWTPLVSNASTICEIHKTTIDCGVPTAFSQLLSTLITTKFESRRAFVRATNAKNEDAAQSYVTQVLKKTKPPPLDRLDSWANALELYGEERQNFMDLAAIAHLPVVVQPRFLALLRQLKTQQTTIDVFKIRLDALENAGQRGGKHE